jgi:hypothetical protein
MVFYHYGSWDNGTRMETQGYRVARPGQRFDLSTGVTPSAADGVGDRLLGVIEPAERPNTALSDQPARKRTGTD